MRSIVAARLRHRDRDIAEAIQGIEPGAVSEMIRQGLRLVLNNVKQPEQKQRPQPKNLDWSHLK